MCSAAPAAAAPQVTLSALFQPDRLGQSTTIHWGFAISEPAPLRSLELRLPAGMGFAASSLGLEECQPALLAQLGPEGCPADSHIGFGTALAEVPATTPVRERANVTALLGPYEGEDMTVLFFVDGRWPANREIILTSHLRHIGGAQGATLQTEVPLLSAWPEGPDIGLLRFRSTIGPDRITYYRRVHGRTVGFTPRGLTVPKRCPRGGFPVTATFTWWASESPATATTRVPCPGTDAKGLRPARVRTLASSPIEVHDAAT
ncbi:MAG TPA: hypothetical protein VK730_13425 [Solirubrobacteraceae bacterium]|nr:hypothetical protein [Solirubrobacteraceae bacterium]